MVRRRWRPATVLMAAVVALATVAGCAAVPTQGPVQRGDVVLDDPGLPIPQGDDPVPDDTPEGIVSGFLRAGAAGLSDDFSVARKFLTPGASSAWDPRARVIVYPGQSGGPEIEERADGSVLVTVPVEAKIDASYRYTEVAAGAREEIVLELTRDAKDQWRISHLDDGVVMSPSNFDILYRRVPLYFATQDREQLVPDVRWFPNVNTATYAVAALLEGPSPWLRDSVRTGVPEGARLDAAAAVTVSPELVAQVDLSTNANIAGNGDINLLQVQLEATLQRLPGVTSVSVSVGQVPWVPQSVLRLERDVMPAGGPYVLAGDRLALMDGGEAVPVEDAAPLTGIDARNPAVSLDERTRVVLDGQTQLLLLPEGGAAPVPLMTGSRLVAPSVDRFGWVWSGEAVSTGELRAVQPSGETVAVAAGILNGRTVRSLRVARDGSRIAIVHSDASERDVTVDVVAVIRDDAGRPQLLGELPLQIGAALDDATEVAWVDEATVAVLGRTGQVAGPTMHLVPLGGPAEALPFLVGARGIAAGRGDRALFLADAENVLLALQSQSWVRVADGVRHPVFPG